MSITQFKKKSNPPTGKKLEKENEKFIGLQQQNRFNLPLD